jgi:ATP-binding cassette subfamily B protein
MSDLTLPDLMSKIINVGIQQNGIENTTPQAIRSSEMDKMLLFMSSDEKTIVAADYQLLDKDTLSPDEYNYYLETYPGLADSPIYILNTGDGDESPVKHIFAQPILIVSYMKAERVPLFGGSPAFRPE